MEIINLAIFSCDKDYGLALGETISVYKNNFIVNVYSSRHLADIVDFDILLFDLDSLGSENIESDLFNEKFKADKRVIKLVESQVDTVCDIELMKFALYKYLSVREIASNILLYHSLLTGKNTFLWNNEKAKFIAFCSAGGGVGKTTVALATGQAIRRYYGKSVLYLNFEEIESTLLYMKANNENLNIGTYLYYLFKAEAAKPAVSAFTICDKFGVNAFMPDKGINRLRELDSEKMALFVKELSECGEYDYILVDMGESLSENVRWIFQGCHKIVTVLSANEQSQESYMDSVSETHNRLSKREERYLEYLQFVVGELKSDAVISVKNMVKGDDVIFDDEENICIELDTASIAEADDLIEISLERDFGVGIKKLMKKVL